MVEFKPVRTAERIHSKYVGNDGVKSPRQKIDMPALGVFCLVQIYAFLQFVQSKISSADYKTFKMLALWILVGLGVIFTFVSACMFSHVLCACSFLLTMP